jgi:hypothetical protein
MQGLFIAGARPKSKKAVKEAVANDPRSVRAQATSLFGDEYDGPIMSLPSGASVAFVGPDPYNDRRFYGTIERHPSGKLVVR